MKNLHIYQNTLSNFFGDLAFIHNNEESTRCAFISEEKRAMKLYVPRFASVLEARLEFFANDTIENVEFSFVDLENENDVYFCSLDFLEVGLYFARIRIATAFGTFYGIRKGKRILFVRDASIKNTIQISVSRFDYPPPKRYLGGVIYHIFVDRFAKGTCNVPIKPSAKIEENWENGIPEYPEYPGAYLENNVFYGGTLYGITERLDYIASLGVSLIYLSPIFDAYSNHKYDTGDYMQVDAMFGGNEALQRLISEAKKRNIGIILDGVFNHTGSDSIYFNKKRTYTSLGAYQSKESPYFSWYEFQEYPDSYTCWWGIPILPRIHPDREECRRFFLGSGGVIEKYARMGIAGFRLDVADELSDDFIAGIKHVLCKNNPEALLYGEVWEDASNKVSYGVQKQYYLGKELDGVMNYPLRKALLSYVLTHDPSELFYVFHEIYPNTPKRILDVQMNLLGTHDTERILTALAGEHKSGASNAELCKKRMSAKERALGIKRLKMLYTVIATLPGIPTIYYGDEVGLEGYSDPFNRMPYPYGHEDRDLLSHYVKIGAVRKENSVYKCGEFSLVSLTGTHLVFYRKENLYVYLTVLNQSDRSMQISFSEQCEDLLRNQKETKFIISPISATIIKAKKEFEIQINEG